MGARCSSSSSPSSSAIAWSMPSWCIQKYEITPARIKLVQHSWSHCLSGKATPFIAAQAKDESLTPLVFFYNNFYYFLFEIIPEARTLFTRGIKAQGRMLANVLKFIVAHLENEETFHTSLVTLAIVHNGKGINAEQYSAMGMALIHAVRICSGSDVFNDSMKMAWVSIYSKMMSVIIPVVVKGTMPGQGNNVNLESLAQLSKEANLKYAANKSSQELSRLETPPSTEEISDQSINTAQPLQFRAIVTMANRDSIPSATSQFGRLERSLVMAQRMMKELSTVSRMAGAAQYEHCFSGSNAVSWMLHQKLASDENDAISIVNALMFARIVQHVDPTVSTFINDSQQFYHFNSASQYVDLPSVTQSQISNPTGAVSTTMHS